MNILLVLDDGLQINKEKISRFLSGLLNHIKIHVHNDSFVINTAVISKWQTFKQVEARISNRGAYDRVFCFTTKPYNDNYFYYEYEDYLTIFSLYGWHDLTTLPISNGIIYFIADYLSLELDPTFTHRRLTGCIYDSLTNKTGVDKAMRQARFCYTCLERVFSKITTETHRNIFKDLKVLMNSLSNSSKWDTDVLIEIEDDSQIIRKRKPKSTDGVHVVIASPGDTMAERKALMSLPTEFWKRQHEKHCGYRIFVHGWEEMASQPGHPQTVINKKIIETSDFVISVFRHKLGTPVTDPESGNVRSESGTSEELYQALNKGQKSHPIAMVYYYALPPRISSLASPEKERIETEWKRLEEFKKKINDKVIHKTYSKANDLLSTILTDLEQNITDYIEREE